MSENLPNIDDLFRKALEEQEEAPSPNVWANLDKNLDKKKVVFISKKYRKLKWVAAALLIFSAGMAMYTWNTRLRNKELVKQNEMNKKQAARTGTPSTTDLATDSASEKLVDSAVATTTDKAVEGKGIEDSVQAATPEAKDEKGTPGLDQQAVAETKKLAENKAAKLPERTPKAADNKRDQDVIASETVSSSSKGKKPSTPAGQANKNIVNENEAKGIVNAESNNKVHPATNEKNSKPANEDVVEKTKRDVDIATAQMSEKNLTISQPANIEPGKAPVLINDNKAITGNIASFKNSSVKPFKGSRFSATAFYSKDFISMKVDNDHHMFREDDRNEIKNKERVSNSSSAGVLVKYAVGHNWNIQSGLIFSTMTTDIQPKDIFARPDDRGNINYRFNCSAGYSYVTLKTGAGPAPGDSIRALSSKNTLRYVALPLGLSYNVYAGKFVFQPGAGLAVNFLTKGKIETEIATAGGNEKATLNQIEGLNSSYLNGSLSLSANYYFSRNLALNFTPSTRFALSGINKDAPVKTYLNSFGLAAGLTVGF